MKTADEMFKELGYKKNEDEYMIIRYDYMGEKAKYKNGKEKRYYVYGTDKRIVFYLSHSKILSYSPTLRDDYEDCSVLLTMQELQAINKKVEELGWNEKS